METILVAQDHLIAGGAAKAANRWVDLLGKQGVKVRQITGDEKPLEGSLLSGKPPRGWRRIVECFTGKKKERKKKVEQRLGELLAKERPDFVWFHNIAGGEKWGWGQEMVGQALAQGQVIWTLHDMWALGNNGQSYWKVDSGFKSGMGQEAKGGESKGSRVQKVCRESGKYKVTLTAPSKWLADLASVLAGQKCWHLPNPIDFQVYSPRGQGAARRRFGLPEEGVVILAGADSLKDERKGFDLLLEAWGQGRKNTTLALFGRNGQEWEGVVNLGSIDTDEAMADAYRAADLYVHPARMENAPCQIQESLACGTPVLAFPVGGIPEMMQSGENGFLADEVTAKSLNECLQKALADVRGLREMREKCWRFAEEQWDQAKLMRQFEELVGDLRSGSR
jgi:glycosyltransferase involved in cell wall biosynthesis